MARYGRRPEFKEIGLLEAVNYVKLKNLPLEHVLQGMPRVVALKLSYASKVPRDFIKMQILM